MASQLLQSFQSSGVQALPGTHSLCAVPMQASARTCMAAQRPICTAASPAFARAWVHACSRAAAAPCASSSLSACPLSLPLCELGFEPAGDEDGRGRRAGRVRRARRRGAAHAAHAGAGARPGARPLRRPAARGRHPLRRVQARGRAAARRAAPCSWPPRRQRPAGVWRVPPRQRATGAGGGPRAGDRGRRGVNAGGGGGRRRRATARGLEHRRVGCASCLW